MQINTLDSITCLPSASNEADASYCLAAWQEHVTSKHEQWPAFLAHPNTMSLLAATAGNSPYLARLLKRYPNIMFDIAKDTPQAVFDTVLVRLADTDITALSLEEVMKLLRVAKEQAALIAALSDVAGIWDVPTVTCQLSIFAQSAITVAVNWLLCQAQRKGEYAPTDKNDIAKDCGIIVLGMGKLGAYELNYSSDIDLILLFDSETVPYIGARTLQQFMSKFATDLVHIMQERTADGYVFRSDLRLRPDPMSTPPAVSTATALSYYETVGQNWERAAMIKARPMAADMAAGERFLRELIPYIWRKYLDFATIADIHSIKRQMNLGSSAEITLPEHNIKTGMGGIREIEFFVQTNQLVWGGRNAKLRVRGTIAGLNALVDAGLISESMRDMLKQSYWWFRKVEHALQMRNDEQTHSLPPDEAGFAWLATFLNYASADAFKNECLKHLQRVHRAYLDSMEGGSALTDDGNLVFTGVEADGETLKTLEAMGYKESRAVSDIIQGWHRGHRKSTKSKRSRQVLTEIVPQILRALSETATPDAAFFHFDDFIGKLPSGAQIFSLFAARPQLLGLVADILGSAPALADTMSRDPTLLDAVLESDFFGALPSKEQMSTQLSERVSHAHDYEHSMAVMRIFNNDRRFQAGVQMLKRQISPRAAGEFLSDLAEAILDVTLHTVSAELRISNMRFAIVGFGKLGGREMTFGSDLDIVFLYEDMSEDLELRTRTQRLSQRLVTALTLLTREGRIYEVDTRLRPGGVDGPLATSIAGFNTYFTQSAWIFELQALSKARVVASNDDTFAAQINAMITTHICAQRDEKTVRTEIAQMRERVAKEHVTRNPWFVKHMRGGIVDCDFIAQYLVLTHAHTHPSLWHHESSQVFANAHALGLISDADATILIAAKRFLSDYLSVSRLISNDVLRDDMIVAGLERTLVEAMGYKELSSLKADLLHHQTQVLMVFGRLLHTPVF